MTRRELETKIAEVLRSLERNHLSMKEEYARRRPNSPDPPGPATPRVLELSEERRRLEAEIAKFEALCAKVAH